MSAYVLPVEALHAITEYPRAESIAVYDVEVDTRWRTTTTTKTTSCRGASSGPCRRTSLCSRAGSKDESHRNIRKVIFAYSFYLGAVDPAGPGFRGGGGVGEHRETWNRTGSYGAPRLAPNWPKVTVVRLSHDG
jgi:hypothetical protein